MRRVRRVRSVTAGAAALIRAPLPPLNPSAEPVPEQADEFVKRLAIGFNGSPRWQEVFEGEIYVVKAAWSGHNGQPLFSETRRSAEHAPRVSKQGNSREAVVP